MFLATITCIRDFHEMLLQAQSIEKYLEPCTHVVIINENINDSTIEVDINFWYKWLIPYYKNHTLLIYPAQGIKHNSMYNAYYSGWHTQQLHKLLIAYGDYYESDSDYLLLDSKNFFVKPAKLEDFKDVLGSGLVARHQNPFPEANQQYASLFNTQPLTDFLETSTPFVIKSELIRKFTPDTLARIFLEPKHNVSEFLFYSYLVREEISNMKEHRIGTMITEHDLQNLPSMIYGIENKHCKIYGIRRALLSKITPSALDFINDWLINRLGLTNGVHPIPGDS